METTIQNKAEEALKLFTRKTRDNGEKFWSTETERPEWLHDLIFAAHADMLPDDFKYDFIVQSLAALSDGDDPDEITLEPSDYYSELTAWLGSNSERPGYCDEADMPEDADMYSRIAEGQRIELREVFSVVLAHLSDEVDRCLDEAS
jgi:hypothetical protein